MLPRLLYGPTEYRRRSCRRRRSSLDASSVVCRLPHQTVTQHFIEDARLCGLTSAVRSPPHSAASFAVPGLRTPLARLVSALIPPVSFAILHSTGQRRHAFDRGIRSSRFFFRFAARCTALAAVDAQFLAVGQYHPLESDDLL